MKTPEAGVVAQRYARLSTGMKMLLWLSLGLLPLGLVAVLASIESAAENRLKRAEETRARIEIAAQRISGALARSAFTIRAASAAISLSPPESRICETTLLRLSRAQASLGQYGLYGEGNRLRCATQGYAAKPAPNRGGKNQVAIDVVLEPDELRFALYDTGGNLEGAGTLSADAIAEIARTTGSTAEFNLDLISGPVRMPLRETYRDGGIMAQDVVITEPVIDGVLELSIRAASVPISALELIMIFLPVTMWLLAAAIGWVIVDRLLLRPLVRMEAAVANYRPGDREFDIPTVATPAREIGALGAAFDNLAQTVARHEADLEVSLERQRRLVREVHHRVKNNLQVVASLINIHARSSSSDEVAAAYASIQRRVDALAVVYRNLYAELEVNRGVALRPLVSELAAGLRGSAPPTIGSMSIKLDVAPLHVNQDTAMSIAFLVTEVIEFTMMCGGGDAAIMLDQSGAEPAAGVRTARLTFEAPGLVGQSTCDAAVIERFERIVTGLSRQLRSPLDRDHVNGTIGITVQVLDETGAAAA